MTVECSGGVQAQEDYNKRLGEERRARAEKEQELANLVSSCEAGPSRERSAVVDAYGVGADWEAKGEAGRTGGAVCAAQVVPRSQTQVRDGRRGRGASLWVI